MMQEVSVCVYVLLHIWEKQVNEHCVVYEITFLLVKRIVCI